MTHRHLILPIFLLTACPDPTETPTSDGASAGAVTQTPNPSSGGNFESDPNEARVDCTANECVTISGSFNVNGDITGRYRVDVQKITQGAAPKLVHTIELQSGGDFSFEIPKGYGEIVITGFIDQSGDGPTPDDAQGRTNIDVQAESISDISLDVALGNAPPPPPQPNADPEAAKGDSEVGQGSDAPTINTPVDGNPDVNPPADDAPPADDVPADNPPVDGPPPDDAQ